MTTTERPYDIEAESDTPVEPEPTEPDEGEGDEEAGQGTGEHRPEVVARPPGEPDDGPDIALG